MYYNIFVNYYIDKNIDRQSELDFCISENLKNKSLNHYVVICNSNEYDNFLSKYADYEKKIIPVIIDKRPTYNDYFQLITKLFPQEDNINIVSNLDIIIPKETLLYSTFYLSGKSCLALTRWDIQNNVDYQNNSVLFDIPDSQDTWIFKGAVPQISGATFTLGTCGCDNSIAHLLSVAEYEVKNPSRNLKTFHYHLTNIRNYLDISGQATEIISPPYKLLPPTL
jgi:hypothetical protein